MATTFPGASGAADVAATAGFPSLNGQTLGLTSQPTGFIPTLRGMTPQESIQAVMSPYGPAAGIPQAPQAVSAPLNAAYLTALAHAAVAGPPSADPQSAPQAGAPQPTIGDYLNQLVGAAPAAPTAADFGPAPTIDQFFSADPYNKALANLATGVQSATGSIGSAYNSANQTMGQVAGLVGQNMAGTKAAMAADQAHAVNAMNGYAQQANAMAGGGGGVEARLAGLQGTLAGQQGAQNSLAAALAGVQGFNVAQDKAAVGLNQQAALGSLAAANTSQQDKIGFAEAQDRARAQQELAAANNSRGAAMAKANTDYQRAVNAYNTQRATILGDASKLAGGSQTTTPHDQAVQQMIDWSNSGNQNGQALSDTASQILSGAAPNGSPIVVNGKNVGRAQSYSEALSRLDNSAVPKGSPEYQMLAGMLGNYFQTNKVAGAQPDILGALKTMAGG